MGSILFKNAHFAEAGDDGIRSVLIEDGIVTGIFESNERSVADSVFDVEGTTLVPGYVDIHIHGAVGIDVNEADADGLLKIAGFLADEGVAAWVPTLVPDSDENYQRTIGEIGRLITMQAGRPVAQAVGVHYEGIFANEKMCGALRPEYFKSGRWFADGGCLPRLDRGVHITTLAPEIEDGVELVRSLSQQGWIPFIGHTRADTATLDAALEAGASHLTHFFNAMTGIHHRDVGVAGWGITNDRVTFDIIADGIHVDPAMLEFACRTKDPKSVTLISDSVAPTGLGDGEFHLWGETISVVNGRTRNERGSIAGSVISMHDAVRQMLAIGFSAAEVSRMSSSNPADLIGIGGTYGSIAVGRPANLLALNADGSIRLSVINGSLSEK